MINRSLRNCCFGELLLLLAGPVTFLVGLTSSVWLDLLLISVVFSLVVVGRSFVGCGYGTCCYAYRQINKFCVVKQICGLIL